MEKIRVLIADDHSLIRKGLEQVLELEDDIEVIGEASNGKEVVEKTMELKPDVVLMDINMPVQNGIYAIREIKEKAVGPKLSYWQYMMTGSICWKPYEWEQKAIL